MSRYHWNIEPIAGGSTSGPDDSDMLPKDVRHNGREFRLLDGRGAVLAVGHFVGNLQRDATAPLHDFGAGALGACAIEYKAIRGCTWEQV